MNGKWKLALAAALAGMALLGAGCGGDSGKSGNADGKIRIGVVQIAEHGSLDEANRGFADGLKKRGYDESRVEIDRQNAQGDQANLKTIVSQFRGNGKDLVCAISTPAAQAAANEIRDVPIVGTAITDYVSSKLAESNEKPGGNVTGVSNLAPMAPQIELAQALVPGARTVGLLYCSSEANSENQAERMKEYCQSHGLAVEERTVHSVNDIQQAAESLTGKVDFIYVPTDNTVASAIPNLVKITDANKIPVIVGADIMVRDGALASLSVDYYRLGIQTGELAADILDGRVKPQDAPIQHQKDLAVVINRKSAETLGIRIPDEIAGKAQMI